METITITVTTELTDSCDPSEAVRWRAHTTTQMGGRLPVPIVRQPAITGGDGGSYCLSIQKSVCISPQPYRWIKRPALLATWQIAVTLKICALYCAGGAVVTGVIVEGSRTFRRMVSENAGVFCYAVGANGNSHHATESKGSDKQLSTANSAIRNEVIGMPYHQGQQCNNVRDGFGNPTLERHQSSSLHRCFP